MAHILILQFRTDQSEAHEQKCFQEQLGAIVAPHSLLFWNAITHPVTSKLLKEDIFGIIMGGSGEFYLGKNDGKDTWLPPTFRFLESILKKNIPLLCLCFGFQILALHEGATIIANPDMEEIGAFPITTLPSAADDPLFSSAPLQFPAHLAHKETVINLPPHLVPLARSDRVEYQVYRMHGKRAWGILFHAELNKKQMTERFFLYLDHGRKDYAHAGVKETVSQFTDTPEANALLKKFVEVALSTHHEC